MEGFKSRWRYALLLLMAVAAIGFYAFRLINWQVFQKGYYDDVALTSAVYTETTDAVRGEIYDVNGVELAVNETGYRVVIHKLFMKDEDLNRAIVRLTELLTLCGDTWVDELPIIVDGSGRYAFDEEKSEEIEILKGKDQLNMNPYSTADECMARLTEKYECTAYTREQQRSIISTRYHMERTGYSRSQPYIFAENISSRAMTIISENMQDLPGVTTEATAIRTYKNGTVAPHVVGITGLISAEEYIELKNKGYAYQDEIGKSGIEAAFEKTLRGSPGSRTYEVQADGSVTLTGTVQAKPGDSVYLTIDADYQREAQKILKEAVQEANAYSKETGDKYMGGDCVGAALVAINVKDFSVLCAASYPTYDLSKFYKDYTKLASNKSLPLFDRAFMGALAPGSTFKPMVASAALQEHAITTKTHITCNGVYTKGGLKLWCMSYHGSIDMYMAIKDSCNVFFAETARLLGIEKMNLYAKRCGLGVKTGVEITESRGTLAGPDYSREVGSEWYDSFVSPAGIGQSDNQFTPLQLATYVGTIANNGVRLRSHVVDRVTSYNGVDVVLETEPEVMDTMGVEEEHLKEVQKAMHLAIGNYVALQDFPISIAGKTGTAENSGSDHSNFICYAPYENPEIAFAVMVEHGAKSSVAINAAKKFLTYYFTRQGKMPRAE